MEPGRADILKQKNTALIPGLLQARQTGFTLRIVQ
jgi:hypothetical protein